MATGPKEIEDRVKNERDEQYNRIYEAIEAKLSDHVSMDNPRVSLDKTYCGAVEDRVCAKYKKAGWSDVVFGSDQTQGDWVDLIR